jgi:predicted nucleotidyltransferase
MTLPSDQPAHLPRISAEAVPADVELILLFGSRAKGTHAPSSDWDIGICFHQNPDQPLRLFELDPAIAALVGCSSDMIDLVDLEHSSYLLQRVVAEEGRLLFERRAGLHLAFCSRAIRQWADWCRREEKLNRERELLKT